MCLPRYPKTYPKRNNLFHNASHKREQKVVFIFLPYSHLGEYESSIDPSNESVTWSRYETITMVYSVYCGRTTYNISPEGQINNIPAKNIPQNKYENIFMQFVSMLALTNKIKNFLIVRNWKFSSSYAEIRKFLVFFLVSSCRVEFLSKLLIPLKLIFKNIVIAIHSNKFN